MKINQLITESRMTCSECGGPAFSDLILAEKKDACYYKVKASAKVWPSAYASGRLVQCRKKGAANYGNKSEGVAEGSMYGDEEVSWEKGGRRAPTGAFRNPNAEKMILHPDTYELIDEYIAKIEPDADREEIARSIMSGSIHTSELEYALQDEDLNEFAPPGSGDDDGGFDGNTLKRMAAQWWNGDEDPRVERTLATAGWEIGQDEGYDNGGVFVVRSGDENGRTYTSWPAEELEDLTEGNSMYGDQEVSWEKGGRRAPTGAFRNPAAKKTQTYNDPNWTKNLPKEKLDALAGPRYKKDKGVAEAANPAQQAAIAIAKKKKQGIAEDSDKAQATRRIQKMLNDKYRANLDVDGIMGPLTIKSINKFMPGAKLAPADQPGKTTAVQGSRDKDLAEGYRDRRDSYQRDQDNAEYGMNKRQSRAYQADGGANDERPDLDPTDWYFVKDGKMFKISVYPNQEQEAMSRGYSRTRAEARAKANDQDKKDNSMSEGRYSEQEAHAIFDDFEQAMADRGLTEDIFHTMSDEEIILETAAWRRKEGKSKKGGLNAKGVASYRRENPGSKLQMAVTTKPSKLKPGSKAAKRRKSFCARMSGVKGPMKKPNGKPTRKALALRKWNC